MRASTVKLITDHEDLVANIARKFHESMQFDTDELISYGRSLILKNAAKWDPARGKFSTFLYWLLRSAFIDYIKKQRKEVFVEIYEDTVEAPASYSPLPTLLQELLDNLSDDARIMVNVVIESPWTENWQNMAERLHKKMSGLGWDLPRFQAAFSEVQVYVKEW